MGVTHTFLPQKVERFHSEGWKEESFPSEESSW